MKRMNKYTHTYGECIRIAIAYGLVGILVGMFIGMAIEKHYTNERIIIQEPR